LKCTKKGTEQGLKIIAVVYAADSIAPAYAVVSEGKH
jgi:hypothetical protein